jgi:hypothetical protein
VAGALSIALLATAVGGAPPAALAADVQARASAALTDSMGVNTHFTYTDTAYGRAEAVSEKLGELGIRHIREGVSDSDSFVATLDALHERYGVRALQTIQAARPGDRSPWNGPLDADGIAGRLAIVKERFAAVNEGLEGPNEYDQTHNGDEGEPTDPDWPATLRAYSQELYRQAKADPQLASRPVVAPSMSQVEELAKLGDISGFVDVCNVHSYPGGKRPTAGLEDRNLPGAAKACGDRPVWSTETGYHNAIRNDLSGDGAWQQPPVSEAAAAKYLPRLYLEAFRAGVRRSYLYELVDEFPDPERDEQERNFGLLRSDLSEKPAFAALRSLIALLDPPGRITEPGTLDVTLGGDADGVRSLLLQKADRTFQLILWQDADSWDPDARNDLTPPPRAVTIGLGAAADIQVFRPVTDGTTAIAGERGASSVDVEVPDHPLVVDIRPGASSG